MCSNQGEKKAREKSRRCRRPREENGGDWRELGADPEGVGSQWVIFSTEQRIAAKKREPAQKAWGHRQERELPKATKERGKQVNN